MIPLKIKPFFKIDYIKNDTTLGSVNCCETNVFNIYYNGEIEKNIILGTYLSGDNDSISLSAKCLKCGRLIKIFNSCIDGCDANCEDDNTPKIIDKNNVKDKLFNCSRCKGNNFSISIKYEYPDEDELKELGFKDISNAFTWITVSLTCNNCGKKYKKFIDFES